MITSFLFRHSLARDDEPQFHIDQLAVCVIFLSHAAPCRSSGRNFGSYFKDLQSDL